ncbi:hypothetical protein GMJLKIPL_0454 [Methylobacterium isbiliense]|jgi:hypothetical protein|uniref:Uncharacterized protein n=1 Tax=Methylobacterium isbiliense TaxID=315478 RepID=A0ABQ4S5W8_9HYPH|nr:hypothetical protein GMJLKIPL_0454 [Methylobacterium isbiliense]
MASTTLLLIVVGAVIGSGIGYAYLSSRAFDRKHPEHIR